MMCADVPLFGLPPTPPTKRAKKYVSAAKAARPVWTKYKPRNRVPCDECIAVLHEAGGVGPYARSARWRRSLGGFSVVLCHDHAEAWKAEEK